MERVTEVFLSAGLPGAACVVLGFVVYYLWAERKSHEEDRKKERNELTQQIRDAEARRLEDIKSLYQMRMGDAETIHKQMLEVVKQCTTVMETTASSLDGHRDASIEHREAQKEAAEELRKLSMLLMHLAEEIRVRMKNPRGS